MPEWPPKSPDLNPMENLWGILARDVYDNGKRQFDNLEELKFAIKTSWDSISNTILETLVNSVKDRCMDVLAKNGKHIDY